MDCKLIARLILTQPLFLISFLLFCLNELDLGFLKPQFIQSYLNDILAPIIILTLTKLFLSILLNQIYKLSMAQHIFFFLYISITYEVLLPYISVEFTSDIYDLLAYGIGTVLYYKYINQ